MTLSWSLLLGLSMLAPPGGDGARETATLKPKAFKKWTLLTPVETWTKVTDRIPFAHAQGAGFPAAVQGAAGMEVDTDGDGNYDDKVKGAKGFLVLQAKTAEGRPVAWGLRFRAASGGYEFSASGAMVGKIAGETVQLIDLNNNGRYDDFGKDGIVIGRSKGASFLSKVVNLKGELYSLEVDPTGSEIAVTPWEGEAGTLDLAAGFKSKGKLAFLVVSDEKGQTSFEVGGESSGLKVPVGSYRIVGGMAEKGSEHAAIRAGKMAPLVVRPGETASLEWGAPVAAEFEFERSGDEVALEPSKVHYFGAAGEEYASWVPDGASPKIFVIDKDSEKVLDTGRFGGC